MQQSPEPRDKSGHKPIAQNCWKEHLAAVELGYARQHKKPKAIEPIQGVA